VSDFLADQDVVQRFVRVSPREILQLDHWGIPWTRDQHGRIEQRPFGGHSYPRATLAADKTGFFEMQTLYDTLQRYSRAFTRYDEFFVSHIIVADGRFLGLAGIHAPSGETVTLQGKALLIASGGAGTLSEIALALKTNKTVILLNFDTGQCFENYIKQGILQYADTPEEVVDRIDKLIQAL